MAAVLWRSPVDTATTGSPSAGMLQTPATHFPLFYPQNRQW